MDFDEVREKKEMVENEIGRLITEFAKETEMLITNVDLDYGKYIHTNRRYAVFGKYWVHLNVRF